MKSNKLKKIIAIAIVSTIVSSAMPVSASADWLKDEQNNWNWIENGNKATGWKQIDGAWYNFDTDGTMKTWWVQDSDGKWYNLAPSGEMRTGWVKDSDGKWYNLAPSGEMKTGWVQDSDGKWYNLASNGEMKTGWIQNADKKWYFADSSGVMQTGIIEVQGKVYVLDSSGVMQAGNIQVNGQTYTTDASGAIIGDNLPKADKAFTNGGAATTNSATSNKSTNTTGTPVDATTGATTRSSSSSGGSGSHNSSSNSTTTNTSTTNTSTTTVSALTDLSDGGVHTGNYSILNTGTFGGSNTTTINGNISIADSGALAGETVSLQNLVVHGNLTIDFGAGNVILDNVTVNGVNVSNVGSNSLDVIDSSIETLNVNDENNDAHIVVKGNASIAKTTIYSGAKLDVASDATNVTPFDMVTIAPTTQPTATPPLVSLLGQFRTVEIVRPAHVDLAGGSIGTMSVSSEAPSTQIKISDSTASVGTLNANANIGVQGSGTIQAANLGFNGTNINVSVGVVAVMPGVTATVGGEIKDKDHGATEIASIPTASTIALDKTALENALASAKRATIGIVTSISGDGYDVSTESQWVTESDLQAIYGEITKARNAAVLATTAEQVADAATELNSAVSTYNAQKRPGSVFKGKLESSISDVGTQYEISVEGTEVGQYAVGSKAILLSAINAAKEIMDKVNATQAEVDAARDALDEASNAFEAAKVMNPTPQLVDKGKLESHISDATTKYEISVEGTEVGQYAAGSKAILLNAINAAKEIMDKVNATQAEVDAARDALDEASNAFEAGIVMNPAPQLVDKGKLESHISDATTKYEISVEGTEVGQYAAGSKAILLNAINAAKEIMDKVNVTQAEVDAAREALDEASNTFEAGIVMNTAPQAATTQEQDNADIASAKSAIESATYIAEQENVTDTNTALTNAQALINALDLHGATAIVVSGTFTGATAGNSGTPNGTNGSYTFTVKINKGNGTQAISVEQTMTIKAMLFS